MENLKITIAKNLAFYRKLAGLTQNELAKKLNYSDKAISKWEHGESLPDIVVLKKLSVLYGVSVDSLISENSKPTPKSKLTFFKQKHNLITIMSIAIVWLIASIIFVCTSIMFAECPKAWLAFIYAIPTSFALSTIFAFIWGRFLTRIVTLSAFVWSAFLAIFLSVTLPNSWLLLIVPIPCQTLIVLAFALFNKNLKKQTNV